MYPTTYEEEELKTLVRYQYLTAAQIALATSHSLRKTQSRLKNLIGTKEKPNYAWRIHRRTTKQNLPLAPAYTYSQKTKRYFDEQLLVLPPPPYEPDPQNLDHDLVVSDVLIRASLLAKQEPNKFELVHSEHERFLRHRNLQLPIVPDGFIEIAVVAAQTSFPILLEVDMATEWEARWKKITNYLGIFDKEAQRAFDFRYPDVLCITRTDHVQKLKRWTEEAVKKERYDNYLQLFHFTHLPDTVAVHDFFLLPRFFRGDQEEPTYLFPF